MKQIMSSGKKIKPFEYAGWKQSGVGVQLDINNFAFRTLKNCLGALGDSCDGTIPVVVVGFQCGCDGTQKGVVYEFFFLETFGLRCHPIWHNLPPSNIGALI